MPASRPTRPPSSPSPPRCIQPPGHQARQAATPPCPTWSSLHSRTTYLTLSRTVPTSDPQKPCTRPCHRGIVAVLLVGSPMAAASANERTRADAMSTTLGLVPGRVLARKYEVIAP